MYCTVSIYSTVFLKMNPRVSKHVEDKKKLEIKVLI